MSKVQMLRALVKQRLTAAAEEIFGLFERTIAEYEEELCRSKEENDRQRHLLDSVFSADDVQQLLVGKEEFPLKQQQWSSSLDQKDSEPQKLIKQEQEEHWIGQEGEPLQELEEDDIIKFTLTRIPVKSEEYEDRLQSSQLHPSQTENREAEPRASSSTERMMTEPDAHSDPDAYLQPLTEVKTLESSDAETEHSDDCKETGELLPAFKPMKKNVVNVGDQRRGAGEKAFSSSESSKTFSFSNDRNPRVPLHNDQNLFSCSVCNKTFRYKSSLKDHMRRHTGEKPFRCSECGKRFSVKTNLMRHMRLHTGEKPFKCSGCGERFTHSASLTYHMRRHTGEKPFSCPICNRGFMQKGDVTKHMRVHSEKS